MKETTPLMAHQSSAESHDQIPSQPLDLKNPHHSEDDDYMVQEQEGPFLSISSQDDIDKDVAQSPSALETHLCNNEKIALLKLVSPPALDVTKETVGSKALAEDNGHERLKKHRVEVAGRVWIPDIWGQEELLKDWVDCSAFDAPLVPSRIMTARAALVEEGRRANAGGLRIENRC